MVSIAVVSNPTQVSRTLDITFGQLIKIPLLHWDKILWAVDGPALGMWDMARESKPPSVSKVYLHWVEPRKSIMASFRLYVVDKYSKDFCMENANF